MPFKSIVLILIGFLCVANLHAQENNKSDSDSESKQAEAAPDKKEKRVVEFTERFNRNYMFGKPRIGTQIEWIDGLDEEGLPFDMESIKGKYSVFVFGCLT